MSVAPSTLDRFVAQAGDLYSLPAVAMEVLELASDAKADARRLKECIERDPALTTKILRVVNSSLFGLAQQVSDLNQALALLGMKPLKLLVLGFSLPDAMFEEIQADVLSRYWQRTLVKSIAAREISERIRTGIGDEAFIAGLLQDIGQLVLVKCAGQPYVRFIHNVQNSSRDVRQLERRALGFDHVQLSAELLHRWGLPGLIVEAIAGANASDSVSGSSNPLVRVLDLAELVATLLCDGRTIVLAELGERAGGHSTFSRSWLDELVITLQEKVEQLASVLSLELPGGVDYREILERARQQMSQVASEVVADLLRERHSRQPHPEIDAQEQQLLEEARQLQAAMDVALNPAPLVVPTATTRITPSVNEPRTVLTAPTVVRGLETDTLLGRLRTHVMFCRQHRVPLSLLLVEIDHYPQVIFNQGTSGAQQVSERLHQLCETIDQDGAICLQTHDAGFALVLPDCDRSQAVRLGNQLIHDARTLRADQPGARPACTISVGSATVSLPPRNFPPEDLVQSADRCLYGARVSGGNVLKSIEIY